jgi:hypothetical protein
MNETKALRRKAQDRILRVLDAVRELVAVQPIEEDSSCCVFCKEFVGYHLGVHRESCPWERLRVAYRERLEVTP